MPSSSGHIEMSNTTFILPVWVLISRVHDPFVLSRWVVCSLNRELSRLSFRFLREYLVSPRDIFKAWLTEFIFYSGQDFLQEVHSNASVIPKLTPNRTLGLRHTTNTTFLRHAHLAMWVLIFLSMPRWAELGHCNILQSATNTGSSLCSS